MADMSLISFGIIQKICCDIRPYTPGKFQIVLNYFFYELRRVSGDDSRWATTRMWITRNVTYQWKSVNSDSSQNLFYLLHNKKKVWSTSWWLRQANWHVEKTNDLVFSVLRKRLNRVVSQLNKAKWSKNRESEMQYRTTCLRNKT